MDPEALIRRVAASPSRPGMVTSISTRSGRSATCGHQFEGLAAVPGEDGLVALEPEQPVEPLTYGLVVIGQQDLPRHPPNV